MNGPGMAHTLTFRVGRDLGISEGELWAKRERAAELRLAAAQKQLEDIRQVIASGHYPVAVRDADTIELAALADAPRVSR